ncbi:MULTISPECIES: hypothetical protein [unclassified Microbacterium]|uniref:hypothetical protein n=1 Tax=Microbacterium TaxID=33882 RepID=UPI003B9F575B
MPGPLTCEVFDTMTGAPRLPVRPSAAPWTRRLTGTGTCQYTFQLDDMRTRNGARLSAGTIDGLFKERARSIALRRGNTVAYAGIIMATDYDDDSGVMTVETHEARVFARWRMLAGVNNITAAQMEADGLSAEAAAGMITERILGWSGWEMPIDFTTTGAGDFKIDNQWYDFRYAEDLYQEIEKRGYEIDLHPVRTAAGYRWQLRVAQRINTGVIRLPQHPRRSIVTNLKIKTDAASQVTGVLVRGKGEGTDTLTAWAGSPTQFGIPVSDVVRDAGDVSDLTTLQGIANATWAEFQARTEQWSFGLMLDDPAMPVTLSQVLPGRRLDIDLRGNRRKPDDIYQRRVIALAGDALGKNVRPEVHPW